MSNATHRSIGIAPVHGPALSPERCTPERHNLDVDLTPAGTVRLTLTQTYPPRGASKRTWVTLRRDDAARLLDALTALGRLP